LHAVIAKEVADALTLQCYHIQDFQRAAIAIVKDVAPQK
jgi:hypothetical protein